MKSLRKWRGIAAVMTILALISCVSVIRMQIQIYEINKFQKDWFQQSLELQIYRDELLEQLENKPK